jgi:NAD(P)-dependent dehydrogenase (short-subunit alcohol dehydrogenase family)
MASKRFENKVVIVTGAAGDIGKVAIRRFAGEGAHGALCEC